MERSCSLRRRRARLLCSSPSTSSSKTSTAGRSAGWRPKSKRIRVSDPSVSGPLRARGRRGGQHHRGTERAERRRSGGLESCARILSASKGAHLLVQDEVIRELLAHGGINEVSTLGDPWNWEQRLHTARLKEMKIKSGTFAFYNVFERTQRHPFLLRHVRVIWPSQASKGAAPGRMTSGVTTSPRWRPGDTGEAGRALDTSPLPSPPERDEAGRPETPCNSMSSFSLRFANEIRDQNPLAKVDVEGSNPFSRSTILRSEAFSIPSRQAALRRFPPVAREQRNRPHLVLRRRVQVARGARQVRVPHHLAHRLDRSAAAGCVRAEGMTQAVKRPGWRDAQLALERHEGPVDALPARRPPRFVRHQAGQRASCPWRASPG